MLNRIDPKCPEKPRSIILSIILLIPYYYYMIAMWEEMENDKIRLKAYKDKSNPTIPNAWHLVRSGWK